MNAQGFDPQREAAALSEIERRYLASTPLMELADAGFIASRSGDCGGGHRFSGFARRNAWLFERPYHRGHLQYRLSRDGAEVRRAIEQMGVSL